MLLALIFGAFLLVLAVFLRYFLKVLRMLGERGESSAVTRGSLRAVVDAPSNSILEGHDDGPNNSPNETTQNEPGSLTDDDTPEKDAVTVKDIDLKDDKLSSKDTNVGEKKEFVSDKRFRDAQFSANSDCGEDQKNYAEAIRESCSRMFADHLQRRTYNLMNLLTENGRREANATAKCNSAVDDDYGVQSWVSAIRSRGRRPVVDPNLDPVLGVPRNQVDPNQTLVKTVWENDGSLPQPEVVLYPDALPQTMPRRKRFRKVRKFFKKWSCIQKTEEG